MVGQDLAGTRVLDAYGGTGLLGLEAWSRGAEVVVVERDPRTASAIRANAERLGADVDVRTGDVLALLPSLGRFDGVLADRRTASTPGRSFWASRPAPTPGSSSRPTTGSRPPRRPPAGPSIAGGATAGRRSWSTVRDRVGRWTTRPRSSTPRCSRRTAGADAPSRAPSPGSSSGTGGSATRWRPGRSAVGRAPAPRTSSASPDRRAPASPPWSTPSSGRPAVAASGSRWWRLTRARRSRAAPSSETGSGWSATPATTGCSCARCRAGATSAACRRRRPRSSTCWTRPASIG